MTESLPDFLSLSDLLDIAAGVVPQAEVRDIGLLESAAARPQITVFGDLAYQGLLMQAAALVHSIARNPPLVSGNKQLAWAAARVFLLINGCEVSVADDEAEAVLVSAASGEIDVKDIAQWFRENCSDLVSVLDTELPRYGVAFQRLGES